MNAMPLIDTTLRDGQQCLWATRMPTSTMLPIAERLDAAGFASIEMIGAVQFDAAVRYLHEDPWERVRQLSARITRTPMQGVIRSCCVLGFEPQPADLNALWIERLVANGCRRFVLFDGLHDIDNLVPSLHKAKELGAWTIGWLTFSDSPVHTDALYAAKAQEFIDKGPVDALMIEDASGVLTPERVRTLIPALRAVIGDMQLGLHSHALVGLPSRSYLAAAELGIDELYTCIPPVADGNAPPSVVTTAANLRYLGYEPGIDDAAVAEIQVHLEHEARRLGYAFGAPRDFDAASVGHQVPGGVMSNLIAQLESAGLESQLPEVLEECTRVRADLGWPIQVTPFAQFIGVQATLNIIQGERYKTVPDEVKKYALGYYGALLSPVDPDVLDRIVQNGSSYISQTVPAREPVLPGLRKRYPNLSDEQRMLRYFFDRSLVDTMDAAMKKRGFGVAEQPWMTLVREACKQKGAARLVVTGPGFDLRLTGRR